MKETILAVIFGNRDFFPDHLVTEARADIIRLFDDLHIKSVMLDESATKLGGVETYADARKCADILKKYSDVISGVLIVLPNFGDEKGVLDAIRLANLNVPILIQGYPDDLKRMDVSRRRDAYCGKISVCNNLYQAGIPYSLTRKHVIHPTDPLFQEDLKQFASVCRVVKGLRNARIGAVGARPGAFNTVRYSEKILEANSISVTTVDLSEILGNFKRLDDSDGRVKQRIEEIESYANIDNIPREKLTLIARLGVVLSDFIEANELDATAIQCWTSMQKNFGVNVCTSMSMMSENLLPSACEVDVTGALTMYAMQLASDSPSVLADWNNNYDGDEDKLVMFHCGNWCRSFLPDIKIATAPILGTIIGEENTYGALEGRAPVGSFTYGRISTDDVRGKIKTFVGEGDFTDDTLDTFGSKAVAHIPGLDKLMRYVCENGFEHHVALNMSKTADILVEAFEKYLDWEVYYHERPEPV